MSRRLGSGAAADVLAVLGTFLVLGAVCGVVWVLLAHPGHLERVAGGFQAPSEVDLARRFSADGWYSVIAIVAGFLGGLGLTWWRSRDFLLTTLLLIPGAALAAAVMALVGHALGPADPHVVLASAPRGQVAPLQLEVTAKACYLVWPVAVFFGSLMVLWSSPRMPEADDPALPGPQQGDESSQTISKNHHRSGL